MDMPPYLEMKVKVIRMLGLGMCVNRRDLLEGNVFQTSELYKK